MVARPPTTWSDVAPTVGAVLEAARTKLAEGGLPVVSDYADLAGWRAGPVNAMWGGPRPLTSTLIGSGLGALLGYGGGWAAEKLFPEGTFEKKGPAKRFALLGAMAGAAPGVYMGLDNASQGKGVLDAWPPQPKTAAEVSLFAPLIPREQFQQAVFADPMTPPTVQAAAAGLVEAASRVSGRPVVTPWDVMRIAVGGGSGLASGYLVGKTLGVLAGLTPDTQKKLQDAGMWAGALKAVVPPALGFR